MVDIVLWVEKINALQAKRDDYKSVVIIDIKSDKLKELSQHPVDAVAYLSSWLTKETGLLYYEDFIWDHTDESNFVLIKELPLHYQ